MSRTAWFFVILFILVPVSGALAVWLWWRANGEELLESGRKAHEEGMAIGRSNDEAGCLGWALEQHKAPENQGIAATVRGGLSLGACLQVSKPTPGFCRDVPGKDSLMEAATWQQQQCAKAGLQDVYCPSLMQQVVTYCGMPKREPRPARPAPAGDVST